MAQTKFFGFLAVSVDGFIARPGGDLDWLKQVEVEGEDYGYAKFAADKDTLLLGRNTWDKVLAFPQWPYEGKRVVVLSHRRVDATHGETSLQGTVKEVAAQLEAQGATQVYVDGGVVVRQFLAAGLLSELTLSIVPVVLGVGIPLFGPGARQVPLRLLESKSYPSGLVQVRYQPG